MTTIVENADLCTVIVTVDADPRLMPDLEEHATKGLEAFRTFQGFVSGALHLSKDRGRIVQYLQWQTEADHLACMNSPRWEEWPSAARFMDLVQAGGAVMDVRTYVVRSTAAKTR